MSKNTYGDENKTRYNVKETEDTTKYGEFISSYFAWIGLERQKKKAKQMEEMTKEKEL